MMPTVLIVDESLVMEAIDRFWKEEFDRQMNGTSTISKPVGILSATFDVTEDFVSAFRVAIESSPAIRAITHPKRKGPPLDPRKDRWCR